jgi:hypothetical protein
VKPVDFYPLQVVRQVVDVACSGRNQQQNRGETGEDPPPPSVTATVTPSSMSSPAGFRFVDVAAKGYETVLVGYWPPHLGGGDFIAQSAKAVSACRGP